MLLSPISVGSLPTTQLPNPLTKNFDGARALPSITGDGAYLQFKQYFYELSCTPTSCNWNIMDQKLIKSVYQAVMMYLPDGYTC